MVVEVHAASMGLPSGERELKCSSCDRSFTRTEHLVRHQRSHRNEKPFKCNYCNSKFSRKDVIKRHHLRYHPHIPEVAITSNTSLTPAARLDTPALDHRPSTPQQKDNASALMIPMAIAAPMNMEGYHDDLVMLSTPSQPLLDQNSPIGSFLADLEFETSSNDLLFGGFGEISNDYVNMDVPIPDPSFLISPPSSLSTELNSNQHWRGSAEISAVKRNQVVQEANSALAQGPELSTRSFPSRLAFERLLTGFFEILPLYLPFIHIPTWRAETSHPCLLQAMSALSASCHKEHDTAKELYRAARSSVTKHLESGCGWATEQPLWLIQSALILIVYGISSGKRDTCSEALSWSSLLANAVRWKNMPEVDISLDDSDPLVAWERWIEYETVVRTKAAAFCILNNLNICFNVTPSLLNYEMMDVPLPCNESEWTYTTPESWIKSRKHSVHSPVRFSEAIDRLLSPSPPTQVFNLSSFGAYVMLHAIMQRMWRLSEDTSTINGIPNHISVSYIALQRLQRHWEENSESSISPRNYHGGVSSNAAALLRLAYIRLHTDCSPVRSALLNYDVERMAQCMKEFSIPIVRSSASLRTVLHSINALRTRVKLGLALKAGRTGFPNSLQLHLVSIEFCLYSSAWMRDVESRSKIDWTTDEEDCVRLVKETLGEVELNLADAQKPYSTQLVYAWALIFDHCALWGVQSFLAASLKRFADSLS